MLAYSKVGKMDHPSLIKSVAFQVHPLTPKRWPDFEKLFGAHGAYGGGWCMCSLVPVSSSAPGLRGVKSSCVIRSSKPDLPSPQLEVQRLRSPLFLPLFDLTKAILAERMAPNFLERRIEIRKLIS
jgi:hypothetical protein